MPRHWSAAPFRALVLFASALTLSHATIINFDDISSVPAFGQPVSVRATFTGLGIADNYAGASWPGTGDHYWGVVNNRDWSFAAVGAFSGTQAAWNWGGALVQEIVFHDPQTVAGAYFNAFAADMPWTADNVQFRAYNANGDFLGGSSLLALDKTSAHPAWQWLNFGQTDVTTLEIVATQTTRTDPAQGWWAMDDLTVTPGSFAIPKPSTLSLAVLVFAALTARAELRFASAGHRFMSGPRRA
jgi:hypothetical protein